MNDKVEKSELQKSLVLTNQVLLWCVIIQKAQHHWWKAIKHYTCYDKCSGRQWEEFVQSFKLRLLHVKGFKLHYPIKLAIIYMLFQHGEEFTGGQCSELMTCSVAGGGTHAHTPHAQWPPHLQNSCHCCLNREICCITQAGPDTVDILKWPVEKCATADLHWSHSALRPYPSKCHSHI